ncbi:Cys-tRNA(Pro) deacylase [Alloalcanivorax mobilis]|uniref:Cys-tRNA(Pro) deacylase n=1 Tax=Alloalcanivorax mobilis TaxID=2019569 RepID=UPI000C771E62|nr:Cys-tRNA(Pro) deacylase [Alloalcanivorax mobilis]
MTPAVRLAERAGVVFHLHSYESDPQVEHYGLEAAQALRLSPERVFKTLLAVVDERPQVAMVPVHLKLDLKALARAAGGKKAVMTDAALAQRLTGYVLGGISPLGQKKRSPLWLDERAGDLETLYMSGGRRGLEIEMAPADLLAITGGKLVPLAR